MVRVDPTAKPIVGVARGPALSAMHGSGTRGSRHVPVNQVFRSNIQTDFFHLDPGQDRLNPVGLKESIAHIGPGKTKVK
jgi:hypothetical protein